MSRRAYVMPLMMVFLAALAALGTVFTNRLSVDLLARRDGEVRAQALWLARSALDAGVSGRHAVTTPLGDAVVVVQGSPGHREVRVVLGGAEASITEHPHTERFTLAP